MNTQFSTKDNRPWKKKFFMIWSGQALSILGSQLVQFALIWHLTVTTGSATVLATASMIGMLPSVLLGPVVGTLVDRWNRRRVMQLSDSLIAIATVLLAVLFSFGAVSRWHIYLLMFIRSLAGSFHGHAMNASTSLMVPIEKLTRIQGINQMLNGGINIVSAPLGALLLNALPLQGILLIDVVTALFAILPLFFIHIPQPSNQREDSQATVFQDLKDGFKFVLDWPGLLIISLMTVGINFTIIPAFSLLPLLVNDYFGGSAVHLSWVEAGLGIGVFSGGALLSIWGGFDKKILTSMLGLAGMGVGALIFAITPTSAIFLAIAGAFVVGFMQPITMGPFYAVIQSTVEPNMQARIFSLLSSLGGGMAPLGLMLAGPIADLFGIQIWFLLTGIITFAMAMVGVLMPAVKNIEKTRFNSKTELSPDSKPIRI